MELNSEPTSQSTQKADTQVKITRHDLLRMVEENGGPEGLDLSNADLSGIDLSSSSISRDLQTLQVQKKIHLPVWATEIVKTSPSGAAMWKLNLTKDGGAPLSPKEISSSLRYGVNLKGAILSGADLQGANLERAELTGADLVQANLESANLWASVLDNANLWRANLKNAYLSDVRLDGAKLSKITPNFSSHELWAEMLSQKAETVEEKQVACLIGYGQRFSWCWQSYLRMEHPLSEWVISTLKSYELNFVDCHERAKILFDSINQNNQ